MFDALKGRTPKSIDEASYHKFAVMAALVLKDGEWQVVFEMRAGGLKRQPGEICLPGGARDPGETSEQNAIRETMEELLVSREQIRMIAQMDTLYTVYDNEVSVFLCELTDYEMTCNLDEVAEIFTVPLKFFMETEPDIYVNTVRLIPEENFPFEKVPGGRNYHWRDGHKNVYFYYYKDWVIWGMTAYIMHGIVTTMKAELAEMNDEYKKS